MPSWNSILREVSLSELWVVTTWIWIYMAHRAWKYHLIHDKVFDAHWQWYIHSNANGVYFCDVASEPFSLFMSLNSLVRNHSGGVCVSFSLGSAESSQYLSAGNETRLFLFFALSSYTRTGLGSRYCDFGHVNLCQYCTNGYEAHTIAHWFVSAANKFRTDFGSFTHKVFQWQTDNAHINLLAEVDTNHASTVWMANWFRCNKDSPQRVKYKWTVRSELKPTKETKMSHPISAPHATCKHVYFMSDFDTCFGTCICLYV